MKRFSKKQLINKKNLAGVPTDKPGVYRIIDNKNKIQLIGKAATGELDDQIEKHRGSFMKGTQFQYRTVSSYEEVKELARQEIRERILPSDKRKQYV